VALLRLEGAHSQSASTTVRGVLGLPAVVPEQRTLRQQHFLITPAKRAFGARAGLALRSAVMGLCLEDAASISRDRAFMHPVIRTEATVEHHSGRPATAAFGEPPRDAVLTAAEVADWLRIARRQVQRLGIPWIDRGRKTPWYQVKDVQAWLEARRRAVGSRRASSSSGPARERIWRTPLFTYTAGAHNIRSARRIAASSDWRPRRR